MEAEEVKEWNIEDVEEMGRETNRIKKRKQPHAFRDIWELALGIYTKTLALRTSTVRAR